MEAGGIYVTTYWSGVVNETDLCFIGERPHERLLGLSVDEIDVGMNIFQILSPIKTVYIKPVC